jgi:hypothetical protein
MVLGISDIPILLVIAGLVFIFIAIVREVGGYLRASIDEKRAKILGIVGIILLASGLITAATGVFLPLEIKPTPTPPVTPTPTPLLTPTPTPTIMPTPMSEIRFTYPKEEDDFPLATGHTVEGTASNVPDDLSLWIVTVAPNNMWYPNTPVVIYKDTWSAKIWIGTPENVNEEFYIHAILADEKADTELQDYMDKSRREGSWPGLYSLPKGVKIYDKVKVIGIVE